MMIWPFTEKFKGKSSGNPKRRYRSKQEPWLGRNPMPPPSKKPPSRQVARRAVMDHDKFAWREARRDRLLHHRLDRTRKILNRRIARGEIVGLQRQQATASALPVSEE